ncbi:asparagine synthase (glutamine-hydrolyzing) [Candidatus Parcubacteria bacterium]|nr:MAG: asparagine synthase (glutamine-hydrolyzing) [Candidatus Parcubacteria bacterium]
MCGIAGIFNTSQEKISPDIIRAMIKPIIHRGPDNQDFFHDGNIALGSARLSIIDLKTGDQPVFNEDGTIAIVFNGEIYNFHEIRERLLKKNHFFKTASDTETIVHLYEEVGTNCLSELNGMFAFALWDKNKERLFVARDRLGVKPLYWTFQNGTFLCGSEIDALFGGLNVKPDFNTDSLAFYFTYGFIPAPLTIYKEIFKLEPGHFLTIDKFGVKKQRYWQAPREINNNFEQEEIAPTIYKLTKDAVERRLISDVSLGAFLSGGFDSSVVVGFMKELAGSAETFSIGFEGVGFFNELPQAKMVAKYFGVKNNSEVISQKTIKELIPEVLSEIDDPFADSSIIPTFLLSKITRKKVKVALSGDGGDEIFVGYNKYRGHIFGRNSLVGLLSKAASFLPVSRESRFGELIRKAEKFRQGSSSSLAERHFIWTSIFSETDKLLIGLKLHPKKEYLSFFKEEGSLEEALLVDLEFSLPNDMLTKVDLASMWNSLEVRSPFLDYRLCEYMFRIPASIRFKNGKLKNLGKLAFESLLPDFVLNYRKQGFEIPIGEWFRQDLGKSLLDLMGGAKTQWGGIINFNEVDRLFAEHKNKKADNSKILWALYTLFFWSIKNKHP